NDRRVSLGAGQPGEAIAVQPSTNDHAAEGVLVARHPDPNLTVVLGDACDLATTCDDRAASFDLGRHRGGDGREVDNGSVRRMNRGNASGARLDLPQFFRADKSDSRNTIGDGSLV